MNGRKEHEIKSERRVYEKLKNCPDYMMEYYNYLIDKTYTSRERYIGTVIRFLEYLKDKGFDIDDVNKFKTIKVNDINLYIVSMDKLSQGTKSANMYVIKSFFDFLYVNDYIEKNIFDKVKMPKDNEERKITYLTKEEIELVKTNIENGSGSELSKKRQCQWKNRDMALIMTGLYLGLRVSSLVEIDVEDLNLKDNNLKIVEKGNKIRTIVFSDNLKNILLKWIEDRKNILVNDEIHALFISNRGDRISQKSVSKLVKKYTYNIDKHITPHKLRSTCATNFYNNTGDIYLTADVLGHSNISNTRRYAQISEERKKKAAEAMDDILF